jgi:hypothetical protein
MVVFLSEQQEESGIAKQGHSLVENVGCLLVNGRCDGATTKKINKHAD